MEKSGGGERGQSGDAGQNPGGRTDECAANRPGQFAAPVKSLHMNDAAIGVQRGFVQHFGDSGVGVNGPAQLQGSAFQELGH